MFLNTARYCNHEALEASCVVEVVNFKFPAGSTFLCKASRTIDQGPRNNLLSDRLSLVEGLRLATSQLAVDANLYTIYILCGF